MRQQTGKLRKESRDKEGEFALTRSVLAAPPDVAIIKDRRSTESGTETHNRLRAPDALCVDKRPANSTFGFKKNNINPHTKFNKGVINRGLSKRVERVGYSSIRFSNRFKNLILALIRIVKYSSFYFAPLLFGKCDINIVKCSDPKMLTWAK